MKIAKSKLYFRYDYFFIVVLFIFIFIGIIYANQPITKITTNNGQEMNNLCDLPENANVFRQYIKEKYGEEISYKQITDLEKAFDKKYEDIGSDWLAKDKNTKIKYVSLGKKCTTKDGVNYTIGLSIVFNYDNKYIMHTPYWRYSPQTFLDKKRPPDFSFFGRKMAEKIIKRDTIGMNKTQFDEYIRITGAVNLQENHKNLEQGINKFSKLPFANRDREKLTLKKFKDSEHKNKNKYKKLRNKSLEVYFYPIKFDAMLRIHPMIYLDIVQVVIAEYDAHDIVKKITAR